EDLRWIQAVNKEGEPAAIVMGRSGEIRINDAKTGKMLATNHVPYGAVLNVKDGQKISKGDSLCTWDPYNAVILSEYDGKIGLESIMEGVTRKGVGDDQTGHREKVIIDTKDQPSAPAVIVHPGDECKIYTVPVGAHLSVEPGEK